MSWTEEDTQSLRQYRDIIDSDDIRIKQRIKQVLLNNRFLIHVINNPDLDEENPNSYFGKNILPYYLISPTQTNVQNFICFSTQHTEIERYNKRMKYMQIIFNILCHEKNIVDKDTYLQRHDLLAALILHDFNWTNILGPKVHCVESKESTVDKNYACRQLVFEQILDADTRKTIDGITNSVDKEVHTFDEFKAKISED